jgi:hypothetical protein
MSDTRNQLLLAALHRAGKPLTSGDVLDEAVGLALAENWKPEQIAELNRKSVSKRLQNMVDAGLIMMAGQVLDESSRRMTPAYEPIGPRMPSMLIPEAPSMPVRTPTKEADYAELSKSQLIALLDVHDGLAQCHGRFMDDLERWREKSRSRLAAVGLAAS